MNLKIYVLSLECYEEFLLCYRQRERRSQNDLKRQFEEFSRNLSFRNRSKKKGGGGGSNNNHAGKRASAEIPTIIAVDEEDVSSLVMAKSPDVVSHSILSVHVVS